MPAFLLSDGTPFALWGALRHGEIIAAPRKDFYARRCGFPGSTGLAATVRRVSMAALNLFRWVRRATKKENVCQYVVDIMD